MEKSTLGESAFGNTLKDIANIGTDLLNAASQFKQSGQPGPIALGPIAPPQFTYPMQPPAQQPMNPLLIVALVGIVGLGIYMVTRDRPLEQQPETRRKKESTEVESGD